MEPMEARATQLSQEQVAGLKRLVANPEWRTCLDLWQKRMELKETVKSRSLRVFDHQSATLHQGHIDGIQDAIRMVETSARPELAEPDEHPYS